MSDIIVENFSPEDLVMIDHQIPMIAIYNKPDDYPDNVVARLIYVNGGNVVITNKIILSDHVNKIHNLMPAHFAPLRRSPKDVTSLVETWF
jgi:hypothetical protein